MREKSGNFRNVCCGIHGSDSQWEDRIRFIFPARGLSYIYPYTLLSIEVQCLMQLRVHLKQVSEKNYACVCGRLLIKICGWFSQKPKLEESSAPAAKRGRRPGRRSIEPPEKKKKPEDSRTECCVCKQSGTNSNLVRYAGKFTIVTETIMHLVYTPEFGITIVSDFSWDDCYT